MASLWAFILAFQACWLLCQSGFCQRPANIDGPTGRINQICPNGICPQFAAGETCHCKAEFYDIESEPVASNQNKVRAVITKKMCWEEDNGDESRFYEDCDNDAESSDCLFEDRIEICYEDNIDAAQAMCRHFYKGGAFGAQASADERLLRGRETSRRRIRLAKLKCPQHPQNLKDCVFEFLPGGSTCRQMVANCWFSPCWQPQYVIRAMVQDGSSTRVRYGQACKLETANRGICSRQCFHCPSGWQGDSRDGLNCFAQMGGNTQDLLYWQNY